MPFQRVVVLLTFLSFLSLAQAQLMHNPALGINFSMNEGQFPPEVRAVTPFAAGSIYLQDDGLLVKLYDKDKVVALHDNRGKGTSDNEIEWDLYKMKLLGASDFTLKTSRKQSWYTNFFLGNDASKWRGKVPVYAQLEYVDVYPGIDLQFMGEYNNFKYNVVVHPEGNLSDFAWSYEGVESLAIENGQLVVSTSVGPVYEMKPIAWQLASDGSKIPIKCEYHLLGNEVRFLCPNGSNPNLDLVIDPVLVFSSYSGSTADNWGYTATFDDDDFAYGGGIVGGFGYPTTNGAVFENFQGGSWDVGLIKFSQDGSTLEYATYLGGSDTDLPSSIVVDGNELVCMGFTGSTNFPTSTGAYMGNFQGGSFTSPLGGVTFGSGTDIFVARFSADGSSLPNATYVGGSSNDGVNIQISNNYGDPFRSEVLTNSLGEVFVVSCTASNDFPVTADAYQNNLNGSQDAVIFKLSPDLSQLDFSTYWGGSSADSGYSLEIDSNGGIYAVGGTLSDDLNLPPGGVVPTFQGQTDGYIIKLDGANVVAGTYVGTSAYDQTFFVELDSAEDVWVTGQSAGTFAVSPDVYSNPGAGQFLQKYSPDLSAVNISTTYGNAGVFSSINICQTAFLIDNCNRIFISGWGGALNGFGDTSGMPTTANAFQNSTDGSDFYVVVFQEDVSDLIFGSFFGASNLSEHVDGGTSRFSPKGVIYQAVCAGCGGSNNFPTTTGSWSQTNNSFNCNMAVFKYDLEVDFLQPIAQANPESSGCAPFEVVFDNIGTTGVGDYWDFGNGGDTSTEPSPTYIYDSPGEYNVMYVAQGDGVCTFSDTAFVTISVGEFLNLSPDFTFVSDPCQPNPNLVLNYTGSVEYDTLVWDLGDGNTETGESVDYTYNNTGVYTVILTVTDEACNVEESVEASIPVGEATVDAVLSADITFGCAPLEVNFTTSESVGVNGILYFGNGSASQDVDPSTVYPVGNEWEAYYVIEEENGDCSDTAMVLITVLNPIPLFPSFVAVPPLCQDTLLIEITYTGGEFETISFDMGDGTVLNDTEFSYLYDAAGTYEVVLEITDSQCESVATQTQSVVVDPHVGIRGAVKWPNVFTPDSDLLNRYFRPFIELDDGQIMVPEKTEMEFFFDTWELHVYNRWGNLIFESDSATRFWDGEIGGNPAEEGVYYYIVKHQLSCGNGSLIEESGSMSLLR